jgi:hypothetical protein
MFQGLFTDYVGGTTSNNIAFLNAGDNLVGGVIVGWDFQTITNGYTAGGTVFNLKKNGTTVNSITVTNSGATVVSSTPTTIPIALGDKFTLDTGTPNDATGTLGLIGVTLHIKK